MSIERVAITPAAAALIETLKQRHGPLLFHQSGGCCDGSSPMCYQQGDFRTGASDVYLGSLAGCPVYMGAMQFRYWAHTHMTIDVVPGRGAGFSLEAPEGVRFLIRSRVFTDEELRELEEQGLPPTGDLCEQMNSDEKGMPAGPDPSISLEAKIPSSRQGHGGA